MNPKAFAHASLALRRMTKQVAWTRFDVEYRSFPDGLVVRIDWRGMRILTKRPGTPYWTDFSQARAMLPLEVFNGTGGNSA